MYADVRDQAKSFSGVAAYHDLIPASIGGNGEPERVYGQAVTSNFFAVTQLPMVLGRGFIAGQEMPRRSSSARASGAPLQCRPRDCRQTISLSGHAYTVVGVVTPAFHSIDQILDAQFWVPLGTIGELRRTRQTRQAATTIGSRFCSAEARRHARAGRG